jgi:hypothetical protein
MLVVVIGMMQKSSAATTCGYARARDGDIHVRPRRFGRALDRREPRSIGRVHASHRRAGARAACRAPRPLRRACPGIRHRRGRNRQRDPRQRHAGARPRDALAGPPAGALRRARPRAARALAAAGRASLLHVDRGARGRHHRRIGARPRSDHARRRRPGGEPRDHLYAGPRHADRGPGRRHAAAGIRG